MYPSVVRHVHLSTRTNPAYWLVVGKGPTSERVGEVNLPLYHVLTLNHACQVTRPTVAHFVDAAAVEACLPRLRELDCKVAVPWHPHVDNKAGRKTLNEFPWAKELGKRLLTYNASTASGQSRCPGVHTVRLKYFSAVAAFNVLVMAGITQIHSVGVDGGTEYGAAFDQSDRLANGRTTFDDQLPELRAAVARRNATWVRLFADAV